MPKMKTHSGSKKRFSVTKNGKVKSRAAARGHRLVSKSKIAKRTARATFILKGMDEKVVLRCYLPYSRIKRSNATSKLKNYKAIQLLKAKEAA